MEPTRCARCLRPATDWAIERDRRLAGTAGCPCGEVIPIAFDDEVDDRDVASWARRPRGWVETPRLDGWSAHLQPSARAAWIVLAALMLPAIVRQSLLGWVRGSYAFAAVVIACVCLVAAFVAWSRYRRWTFEFADDTFRANARGEHYVVPIDRIVRFSCADAADIADRNLAPFVLNVVRRGLPPVRIPLFVDSAEQAQFILGRARTLLETGGRSVEHGYRGERCRVADDGEAVAEAEAEAAAERSFVDGTSAR